MKNIKLIFLIIFISVAFLCCSENNSEKVEVNGQTLKTLVMGALKGSIGANQRLSGLLDADRIINGTYNLLKIDSNIVNGKKIFSVLVEYPNPEFNLLAIYDNYLNFYLLDKSLNGNLSDGWEMFNGKFFLVVSEKFRSKDSLNIERTSFYSEDSKKWGLTFRFFTKYEFEKKYYTQKIKTFSPDKIETIFKSNDKNFSNANDEFLFNEDSGRYLSNNC